MQKSKILSSIVSGLALTLTYVGISYAASNLPTISKVCENKAGQLIAIDDGFSLKKCPRGSRVAYLVGEKGEQGEPGPKGDKGDPGTGLDITSIYTKVDGPFQVTKGAGSTFVHGCNRGDLPLGGGLHSTSGAISNWETVKSTPNYTEPSDLNNTINGWVTTVINHAENGSAYFMTRCLDIQ